MRAAGNTAEHVYCVFKHIANPVALKQINSSHEL